MLLYSDGLATGEVPMLAPVRRATLFALYQLSVLTGIALLPVALAARQLGVPIPIHRVVETLQNAYETTEERA